MKKESTHISDVSIFCPTIHRDERGTFSETYNTTALKASGLKFECVQENRSFSKSAFTVRGLHFQITPFAQAKLIFVQHGRILDVIVDLRRSSATFGRHAAFEISAQGGEQLLVPKGFAHGFCTLEPDTVVTYMLDQHYAPAYERGLHWQTPALAIEWPCSPAEAILSPKDLALPSEIDRTLCYE